MKKLTQERLKELFHYDPDTGVFIGLKPRGKRTDVVGVPAGGDSHGYTVICIDYVHYRAHVLAWFYVHGEWPTHEVDHKNRKRSDNRISNLRLATHQQNMRNNRVCPTRTTSGVLGVAWDSANKKWRAHVSLGRRMKCLGRYKTIEEALAARIEGEKKYYGEFGPRASG